ncbi:hypothetical protein J7L48_04470, partial [bacterium]|nr:hypothetical protein [bacterium]
MRRIFIICLLFIIILSPAASNMKFVGGNMMGGFGVKKVLANADNAFVLSDSMLIIINYSEKTKPYEENYYLFKGSISSEVISGNYLVVSNNGGFSILNIADHRHIFEESYTSITTDNYIAAMEIKGNYLYLAVKDEGLRVYDISDTTNPNLIYSFDHSSAKDLDISGNYLYLLSNYKYFIFNISNPAAIIKIYEYSNIFSQYIVSNGSTLFTSSYYTNEIKVFNVTNPNSPVFKMTMMFNAKIKGMVINENYLHTISGDGSGSSYYTIKDVSNPDSPTSVCENSYDSDFISLSSTGNYSYLGDWEGIRLLDISTVSNPDQLSYYNAPVYGSNIIARGNYAYSAGGQDGLIIYDITNDSYPVPINYVYYDWGDFYGVDIKGNYAYVTDVAIPNLRALKIFNISDPYNVNMTAFYPIDTDWFFGVRVFKDNAYIAAKDLGVLIIDVSNPSGLLKKTGEYIPNGDVYDILIDEEKGQAFICYSNGIDLIDIANPSSPKMLDSISLGNCGGISKHGDYLYICDNDYYAGIIKVENNSLSLIKNIPFTEMLYGTYSSGFFLYISLCQDHDSEIKAFNIQDPENPVEVASYSLPGIAIPTFVHGKDLYIESIYTGMLLLENEAASVIEGIVSDTLGNKLSDIDMSIDNPFQFTYNAKTDKNGFYFSQLIPGATYTTTPNDFRYHFTPDKREYSNINGNYLSENFTATPRNTCTINGNIHNNSGKAIGGVKLIFYLNGN